MNLKERIHFYLIDCKTPLGKAIDISILLLNLFLCLLFVYSTYDSANSSIISTIDNGVVIILIVEFLLRLYASENRLKHLVDPYTIIDLIAIVPTLIGWFFPNEGFLFLTLLRALRVVRAFRFFRFLETEEFFFGSVADYTLRILRLVTTISMLFFVSAGLIYTTEFMANDSIRNFGDALYYTVVTLTTVGFGDITPQTEWGRFVTTLMILSGIVVIPWQAGQVIKYALQIQNKEAILCRHCGLKYHDRDASHCKHCGNIIYQESDG